MARSTNRAAARSVVEAARVQRARLALSSILAVAAALAGLVPYVVVFLVADELFVRRSGHSGHLVVLAFWAAGAVVLKVMLKALANAVSHAAAYRVLADLRLALAEKITSMPLGRVRSYSSGHLRKVLQDDVEQLELGLSHAIPDLSAALAVPLASIVVMFVISWPMALAALFVVILAVALVVWGVRRSSGMATEESRVKSDLNTSVISFLRGMKEIRGFMPGRTGFAATDAAITGIQRVEDAKMARGKWQAVASTALVGNALLFLLPLGLWLLHAGALTSSSLIFFLLIGTGFAQPLMNLMISLAVLQYQIEAGVRGIDQILKEPDLTSPSTPRVATGTMIECRGVRFAYGDGGPEVLGGIDLTVPAGGSLALVGPSGGGKSTLMGLLARFHDPTAGAVMLGGVDLREMDPVTLMTRVAYVQQDDHLFADTVLNNIRMARPDATDEEVVEAARRARVADFIPNLADGWDTVLPSGGGNLSGGQRQRISIARAMLKGAGVVLLDEATAFLDPESERAVGEAVAELRRSATVVTIAHRLGSIVDHDRVAYIDEGRVLALGRHADLLTSCPDYAELWEAYQHTQGWRLEAREASAAHPAAPPSPRRGQGSESRSRPGTAPRVAGLTRMGPIRQWLSMLGERRGDLWRRGIWWILLDGMLTSAPIVVLLLALLEVLGDGPDSSSWWRYGLILLALYLARWVAGVGLASTWWPTANAAIAALRRGVLAHLRRIPMGRYVRFDVGRTATLVTSDLPLIDFTNLPARLIVGVIQPLVATVVLFLLDWQLAVAALLGLPVFFLLLFLANRVQRGVMGEVTRIRSQATTDLLELVRGTAVLRANPDAPQIGRYRATVEELRRASVAMAVRTSPVSSLASVILELGFAMLVLFVCLRTVGQSLPQDVALLLLVIALSIYRPYQELMDLANYRHLQEHIVERVAEVWDVDPMPENPVATATGSAVEFRSVGFSYDGRRPVLTDVSFEAAPGRVTALVGPSGAGKTTVNNLVARFWDTTEGEVLIGGADVRHLGEDALAGLVTTVHQDVYLFPATVRENLTLGAQVEEERLLAALEAAQAWGFVERLPRGLDEPLSEGGLNLSGGQRQRLAIARALVKDAPVLLLDEAVAAVDPRTEVKIQRALESLVQGRTVMVVAHRLNTIQGADRIVVLNDHTVEASGTHGDLLALSATYRRLWEATSASTPRP
ncbi:ABC transporter ATP-binding protein [Arachnia propionica]|uniref:ABC transporter ATP-binding protein n=1 Tax=Arachnia propionica TaxID=1750 RepID=A0A3P1WVA6_9ACTN|nr:ABC transporter ATP-binding protein [Arachnia propionica]